MAELMISRHTSVAKGLKKLALVFAYLSIEAGKVSRLVADCEIRRKMQ